MQELVENYNNSIHRTINMKPKDVDKNNEERLLKTVYKTMPGILPVKRSKFKLNDHVRISKHKSIFEKGYTPNWTTEIFKIYKVQPTHPTTYLLLDYKGSNIKGAFYDQELQKVQNKDVYIVDKIIRRRGSKVYVKWLGSPSSANSWINERELT